MSGIFSVSSAPVAVPVQLASTSPRPATDGASSAQAGVQAATPANSNPQDDGSPTKVGKVISLLV
jgi:hypothetical protein